MLFSFSVPLTFSITTRTYSAKRCSSTSALVSWVSGFCTVRPFALVLVTVEGLEVRIHVFALGRVGLPLTSPGEQACDSVGIQPLARRGVVGDHPDEEQDRDNRAEKISDERRDAEADYAHPW